MTKTTKWVLGTVGVVAAVALAAVLGILAISPADTPVPTTEPVTPPALGDGDYFAFISVGEENGRRVIGVDVAEFLTGEEAYEAAVEAGVIEPGEDLPNDYFIANPDKVFELMHIDDDARVILIPADDTSGQVMVNPNVLAEIYAGSYDGVPLYGVIAGQPIPMDVVIDGGVVADLNQVYLP